MNITYRLNTIGTYTLIEACLTGTVRNDDWIAFFSQITTEAKETERLYMLIDEKHYESEINYETAKILFQNASKGSVKEFIISFSTSDPLKVQMARLYDAMAKLFKVPLVISYHLSLHDARNAIKNLCVTCYSMMSPRREK